MYQKKLFKLIIAGNIQKIKDFFESFIIKYFGRFLIDFNARGYTGDSPLLVAAKKYHSGKSKDHSEIVSLLLKKGFNVNSANLDDWTPLMYAVRNKNLELAKILLDGDKNFKPDSKYSKRALLIALEKDYKEIVTMLESRGVRIKPEDIKREYLGNEQKDHKRTLLMYALKKGKTNLAVNLINSNVNFISGDKYGKTPLMYAIEKGDTKVIKTLIDKGVNVNEKDIFGKTPLIYAAERGNINIVEILLQLGCKVDGKDEKGKTAFIYSAENGQADVLERLIKNGADVNLQDNKGRTALVHASKKGRSETIKKLLLNEDVNVNVLDHYGRNSLMYASRCGDNNKEIVGLLLQRRDLKYIKQAMHVYDLNSNFGFGHSSILLINNSGDGIHYTYTPTTPFRGEDTKGKIDTVMEFFETFSNMGFESALDVKRVSKTDIDNLKIKSEDEIKEQSEKAMDQYPRIYRYHKRMLMDLVGKNEIEIAIKGANMQWKAEKIHRNPKIFKMYTRNCTIITEHILNAGGLNVPIIIAPKNSFEAQKQLAKQRNWTILENDRCNFDKTL